MKCKACETVLTGRQREFCSDKCRKRASRTGPGPEDALQSTNADKMAVEPGQSERGQASRTASLDDCQANPQDYGKRALPEALNWGKWMSADELAKAKLIANRVTIPGDWDYAGVCKQVDGEWIVKPDPVDISTMTDTDLQLKLKSYPGASWTNSPEHKEVQRRKQAASPAPVHEQAGVGASQA